MFARKVTVEFSGVALLIQLESVELIEMGTKIIWQRYI